MVGKDTPKNKPEKDRRPHKRFRTLLDRVLSLNIKKVRWWFVMGLFLLMTSFWLYVAWFALDRYSHRWKLNGMQVSVFAPKYISVNEEEEIRYSIENMEANQPDITLKLRSDGSMLSFLASPGSNNIYSGQVKRQEQINGNLKLFVPFDRNQPINTLNKVTGLSLWGVVGDGAESIKICDLPLGTAPIPMARSVMHYLGALLAALVLWMGKEVWEQAKT
jgi:hypothetical protein